MSFISGLFNLIALLYLFRGLQLVGTIWRGWRGLVAEPLTPQKQQIAEQAAFYVAVPPSVLVHELGHAVAIWLFGGEVVEFAFRVFWGYVRSAGSFTAAQDWFISLAGTLGSLLFGVGIWLLLRNRTSSLHYFGLRAFRFQIFFALVYYPLFTLVLPIGDWATIYDFGATPILSGITAVFHAGMLLGYWLASRRGWFEMASHSSATAQQRFAQLETAVRLNPHDTNQQMQYIEQLRQGGAVNQAREALNQFLAKNPQSGLGHLQRALLLWQGNNGRVSKQVGQAAAQALQLGLDRPYQQALAHQLVAEHEMQMDRAKLAVQHLTDALAVLPAVASVVEETAVGDPFPHQQQSEEQQEVRRRSAHLHFMRSRAYRRLQQFQAAKQDAERAITLAQQLGDKEAVAQYEEELNVVHHHAGGNLL